MTFEELLYTCKDGMIEVKCNVPIVSNFNVGQVVTLRSSQRDLKWKGCAVLFPGKSYDIWFEDNPPRL